MEWCFAEESINPLHAIAIDEDQSRVGSSRARRAVVRLLLEHDFDPNIQFACSSSLCSWTPRPPRCSILHMACLKCRYNDSEFSDEMVMVKLLDQLDLCTQVIDLI